MHRSRRIQSAANGRFALPKSRPPQQVVCTSRTAHRTGSGGESGSTAVRHARRRCLHQKRSCTESKQSKLCGICAPRKHDTMGAQSVTTAVDNTSTSTTSTTKRDPHCSTARTISPWRQCGYHHGWPNHTLDKAHSPGVRRQSKIRTACRLQVDGQPKLLCRCPRRHTSTHRTCFNRLLSLSHDAQNTGARGVW